MKYVLLVCLTLARWSFAGDEVGGGGIAEKNVVFAYINLNYYSQLCFSSEICRLTTSERVLLKKIQSSLDQELPVDKLLVFKSEKKEPGFFVVDGHVRIAKTGYQVGTPIYVNVDMLYLANRRAELKPLSLSASVALLIHELGHHQGETSHLKLDILGSKVQSLLAAHMQQIDGGRHLRDIQATVIDFDSNGTFSQVLVSDDTNIYDLTPLIKANVACAPPPTISRDEQITFKVDGFNYWNLHWAGTHTAYVRDSGEKPLLREIMLTGSLDVECSRNIFAYAQATIALPYRFVDKHPRLVPEEFHFLQEPVHVPSPTHY